MNINNKKFLIFAVAVFITIVAEWIPSTSSLLIGNEWFRDQFIRLNATDRRDDRVLVVDIDDVSLAEYKDEWPWPRSRLADLVEILLSDYAAQGVALDIVFPSAGDALGDKRLALLAEHANLVVAQVLVYPSLMGMKILEGELIQGAQGFQGNGAVHANGYRANDVFFKKSRYAGNIGFIPDADGTLRRIPVISSFDERQYPTLAVSLVNCCFSPLATTEFKEASQRISYRRTWPSYTVVSASNVLSHRVDPALVRGRLVLIGASAFGASDHVVTPTAENLPGIAVHAAFLSDVLDHMQGVFPAQLPGRVIATLFALASTAIMAIALARLSAAKFVIILSGMSLAWIYIAAFLAVRDPLLHVLAPLLTNAFVLAVGVPFYWQLSQRRSHYLLNTLRQYVAPSVVSELLESESDDPLSLRLGDITTLIADMENYSAQVALLPVEESAELTRDFLACLTEPVINCRGTLDKYTGDGLVAFWGAPLANERHADWALSAAIGIVTRVTQFNADRAANGKNPVRVRIGIESGPALTGDFGTEFRSIYTAVGDSVNMASRLEQLAREYPYSIIVGPGAVSRSKLHTFISLGERQLRGKSEVTRFFTVVVPPHTDC